MNTSLEHLPEHKQNQLREISGIIVKAVDPEKVILFGSHATGRWVEHRYTEGGITYEYISDYDILIITKSGESRKDYEVQDVIENRCVYKTPVTVITQDIDFVNKMLSEGQYFFTDIEQEGILLYDAGNTPLAERKPLIPAEAKAIAQNYYEQWFYSAQAFLKIARYYLQEGDLKEGAFNLHQGAERAYNAIILVHAGYKSKTHNLGKLKRYSKRFSEELDSVFPDNTPQEKHLFDLLKRGYIDTRYKDHYEITTNELRLEVLDRFTNDLGQESWKRRENDAVRQALVDYFVLCGYGQKWYTEAEIRQMFKELDAIGSLWPDNGGIKLIHRHAQWKEKYQDFWFKKWFSKLRRKP